MLPNKPAVNHVVEPMQMEELSDNVDEKTFDDGRFRYGVVDCR